MKKKIITVALVLSSVCVMAQQKENRDTDGSILRGPYETNSFWSNWYIGVGGGINIYEGELDNKTSVGNRIAPALDVSLGKWITPSYGVRLQYSGLKAKGLTDASGMYAKGAHRGYYKEEFNVSNLHADFMWNWSNGFIGYRFLSGCGCSICLYYSKLEQLRQPGRRKKSANGYTIEY